MVIFLLLTFLLLRSQIIAKQFQLQLKNWQLRFDNQQIWRAVTVPSTLTQNLIQYNLISPNPYFRDNFLNLYKYQTKNVDYRTLFNISKQFIGNDLKNYITFKGLDTHCDVYLNQVKILTSRNMYVKHRIQVKFNLQNQLLVQFNSSATYDIQMANLFTAQQGFSLPQNFSFTRKAAYQYGWDWGPRILTIGIWKSVIVESFTGFGKVLRTHFSHSPLSQRNNENDSIQTSVKFDFQNNGKTNFYFNVTLINENTGKTLINGVKKAEQPYYHQQINFTLSQNPNSLIWWSWDLGTPVIIRINITIYDPPNNQSVKYSFISGIRDIKVIQEVDVNGKSFTINLNGGNYIPPQMSMTKVPKSKYQQIIKDAIFAKYNMIRVWGGGQFQDDYFYQLCDRNGIMIWHDLMYACALYSPSYLKQAQLEEQIYQNIAKIDNHPSLAIWNGNNQVWIGWQQWGWQRNLNDSQKQFVQDEYNKLFKQIIPNALLRVGSKNFYWQTSPSASSNNKQTMKQGDVHSWRVWGGGASIDQYQTYVGRFHSQYGMQSMPEMSTIDKFTYLQDHQINNIIMRLHQRHPKGDQYLPQYTIDNVGKTSNFSTYIYFTQIMQAYALQKAIGTLRGKKPFCMGSIYWQLNDVWPCATWSTVDYYGNYKAAHYKIRNLHNRILVNILHEPATNASQQSYLAYIVNDQLLDLIVLIKLQIMYFNGSIAFEKSYNISISELSQEPIQQLNITLIQEIKTKSFVNIHVKDNLQREYRNQYFFVKPIQRQVRNSQISKKFIVSEEGSILELEAKYLATYVHLQRKKTNGQRFESWKLDDNYFTMLPGEKRKIILQKDMDYDEIVIEWYEKQRLAIINQQRQVQNNKKKHLFKEIQIQ